MTELLRVAGIALICALCLMALNKLWAGGAVLVRVGGTVMIFGIIALMLGGIIGELRDAFSVLPLNSSAFGTAFALMLKALGIALVSKFCADICRDMGENALAGGVESAGRVAIFTLALPVLREILEYAARLLNMGK